MSKPLIVIAEDEVELREVLTEYFVSYGIDVVACENGKVALAAVLKKTPHVVLSDLRMPEMTGLELLTQLRAHGYDLPFIFLSGFGDDDSTLQAMQLGAYDFLNKPVSIEKLFDVVKNAIALSQEIEKLDVEINRLMMMHGQLNAENMKLIEARKQLLKMRYMKKLNESSSESFPRSKP